MENHKYNGHVEKKGIFQLPLVEIVVVQTEFIVTVCKSQ